jgi:hypothetical protein
MAEEDIRRREGVFTVDFVARNSADTRSGHLGTCQSADPEMGVSTMNQPESVQPDFESRLRYGLSAVLNERPELRDVLPLAAMMDDTVRWCA